MAFDERHAHTWFIERNKEENFGSYSVSHEPHQRPTRIPIIRTLADIMKTRHPILAAYFFFPGMALAFPLRVLALFFVRCPRVGKLCNTNYRI